MALRKGSKPNQKLITLRTHEDIVDNIGGAKFYIQSGNVNFILRPYHDRAELLTSSIAAKPGANDLTIISDIYDTKQRLVCRTKFIIYIDVGQYTF